MKDLVNIIFEEIFNNWYFFIPVGFGTIAWGIYQIRKTLSEFKGKDRVPSSIMNPFFDGMGAGIGSIILAIVVLFFGINNN
jgi:hypothetical protein